jgi:hypothetical protein
MLNRFTSQNWSAWINTQPIQPTPGTLIVVGEVFTHPSKVAVLVKRVPQGINPKILLLEVVLHSSGVPTKQPQWVKYAEALSSIGQYESIEVFFGQTSVAIIKEVPIIS